MQEQARRLREPLRWGRREKTVIGVFLAIVAAAVIALAVFALSSGAPARADCITLKFASTLGGAEVKGCGSKAQTLCARAPTQTSRTRCARVHERRLRLPPIALSSPNLPL